MNRARPRRATVATIGLSLVAAVAACSRDAPNDLSHIETRPRDAAASPVGSAPHPLAEDRSPRAATENAPGRAAEPSKPDGAAPPPKARTSGSDDAGTSGADDAMARSADDAKTSGADVAVTGTPEADPGYGAAPPGVPGGAASSRARVSLERAYLDIYCAQRRGEAVRLREIYAKHGFSDPREWRRAWNDAARDREWLASVTRAVIDACP